MLSFFPLLFLHLTLLRLSGPTDLCGLRVWVYLPLLLHLSLLCLCFPPEWGNRYRHMQLLWRHTLVLFTLRGKTQMQTNTHLSENQCRQKTSSGNHIKPCPIFFFPSCLGGFKNLNSEIKSESIVSKFNISFFSLPYLKGPLLQKPSDIGSSKLSDTYWGKDNKAEGWKEVTWENQSTGSDMTFEMQPLVVLNQAWPPRPQRPLLHTARCFTCPQLFLDLIHSITSKHVTPVCAIQDKTSLKGTTTQPFYFPQFNPFLDHL